MRIKLCYVRTCNDDFSNSMPCSWAYKYKYIYMHIHNVQTIWLMHGATTTTTKSKWRKVVWKHPMCNPAVMKSWFKWNVYNLDIHIHTVTVLTIMCANWKKRGETVDLQAFWAQQLQKQPKKLRERKKRKSVLHKQYTQKNWRVCACVETSVAT